MERKQAVIVYYSYSGNTHKVAEVLSQHLESEYSVKMLRIQALDESDEFWRQGKRAFIRKRGKITGADFDLTKYDLVCIGTPVWSFAPAPAMNTYLDKCFGIEDKPIMVFTTHGSGLGVGRCHKYMKGILLKKGASQSREFSIQQLMQSSKNP